MATEYGFVYALTNESMPGIFKIGFTLNHPKARMDQLSSATACPTPFLMAACIGVAEPRNVEAEMHAHLAAWRVNAAREFFKAPASVIQDIFRDYSDIEDDLVQTNILDEMSDREDRTDIEREQEWKIDRFLAQCADPIHWPERKTNFSDMDDEMEIPF